MIWGPFRRVGRCSFFLYAGRQAPGKPDRDRIAAAGICFAPTTLRKRTNPTFYGHLASPRSEVQGRDYVRLSTLRASQSNSPSCSNYDRQYLAVSANGERVIELATDPQPTGSLAGCSSRKFTLSRWSAGRGNRSALCVRFTVSIEVAMDEAADQLVETDSSAVIMRTIAKITMQPLPRYGKARFIDLRSNATGQFGSNTGSLSLCL